MDRTDRSDAEPGRRIGKLPCIFRVQALIPDIPKEGQAQHASLKVQNE